MPWYRGNGDNNPRREGHQSRERRGKPQEREPIPNLRVCLPSPTLWMERVVRGNLHATCGAGEKPEVHPRAYLSPLLSGDRIHRARAAALVVYDFCVQLEIPILILGHTSSGSRVDIYSYAEADRVDETDRYRLMALSPRRCNRDGMALRLTAEKLMHVPAEERMLLVITDGQPNSLAYTGEVAEEDLRQVIKTYGGRGMKIYAAAIGEDREKIHGVYGERFLDISDLDDMPTLLTKLIASSLLH